MCADKDLGNEAKAAHYFKLGYNTTVAPFYEWHEGVGHEGSSAQGAPNFITGAGGWLQSVSIGYGGLRWERPGVLTLRDPQPLPNSTALKLRGVVFLGARLDIVATSEGWTVALSASVPGAISAPVLELLSDSEVPVPLTLTPVSRGRGTVGYVRVSAK